MEVTIRPITPAIHQIPNGSVIGLIFNDDLDGKEEAICLVHRSNPGRFIHHANVNLIPLNPRSRELMGNDMNVTPGFNDFRLIGFLDIRETKDVGKTQNCSH